MFCSPFEFIYLFLTLSLYLELLIYCVTCRLKIMCHSLMGCVVLTQRNVNDIVSMCRAEPRGYLGTEQEDLIPIIQLSLHKHSFIIWLKTR